MKNLIFDFLRKTIVGHAVVNEYRKGYCYSVDRHGNMYAEIADGNEYIVALDKVLHRFP